MPEKPTLDFKKVEALRKHMLLTKGQMARVLDVSRVTYTEWQTGGPIRKNNEDRVRRTLRKMLAVMVKESWPSPDVLAMTAEQRMAKLLECMQHEN